MMTTQHTNILVPLSINEKRQIILSQTTDHFLDCHQRPLPRTSHSKEDVDGAKVCGDYF